MSTALKHIVLLNDSSVVKGGATGLAIRAARQLAARGYGVTFVSGDDGEGAEIAQPGITHIALGGALLLDRSRTQAARDGVYDTAMAARLRAELARLDRPGTVFHLHGWSRILSPSVFSALAPYAARSLIHAHDYFLGCPNGIFFDFRRQSACTRVANSPSQSIDARI